jgi:hypothetical protein
MFLGNIGSCKRSTASHPRRRTSSRLSITSSGHIGEWMYRSRYSWPAHEIELNVSFTLQPLYPWEMCLIYPFYRTLVRPKYLSGWSEGEKNIAPTRIRSPTPGSFAIIVALQWLQCCMYITLQDVAVIHGNITEHFSSSVGTVRLRTKGHGVCSGYPMMFGTSLSRLLGLILLLSSYFMFQTGERVVSAVKLNCTWLFNSF